MREVWVFIELSESGIRSVSLQLLGKGKELASEIGGRVAAVVLGGDGDVCRTVSNYGAERVYDIKGPFGRYKLDIYTEALAECIKEHNPYIFLFGATHTGRELAPSVAAKLKLGLTADCTGLSILRRGDEDLLLQTRPAFGGNIIADITCKTFPQMATVRPNVMRAPEPSEREVEIIRMGVEGKDSVFELLEEISSEGEHRGVDDAKIVVAGGRGLKKKEDFEMLEDIASLLGGSVGCSRPVVEKGWMPKSMQVGQSGKTISPELYIAVGVSGSVQHQAGIKSAKKIVAINSDSTAPILNIADYSIVGNLYEIVPEIIRSLNENR